MVSIKKSFVSYMSFYYYIFNYIIKNYIQILNNKQEFLTTTDFKRVTSSIKNNNVKKSFRVNQLTLKFIINF
jgi:hypothetical protein